MDLHYRHIIHQNTKTAKDLLSLEGGMRDLLTGQLNDRDNIQALNLACGRADETGVLAKIISEKSNAGHIEGLDLRAPEIAGANQLWKPALNHELNDNSNISCNFRVCLLYTSPSPRDS